MPENWSLNLLLLVALAMLGGTVVASPPDGCLTEQGRIPRGYVSALEVDFPHLVFGSGTALVLEDVSNPRFPRRQGILDLGAEILDLEISNQLVFAVTELGLHIVDIERPPRLRQTGFETTPHPARAVEVFDRWAWVAGGEGLSLINIRVPSSPWLATSGLSPSCDYGDLALQYPLLYAIGCGLKVIDVSRPMFPTTLARLGIGGKRIAVDGTTAAVVVGADNRLRLIDLSDPSNPVERGSAWTHGPPRDVALMGDTAVSSSITGCTVVDIESLDNPAEIAHVPVSGGVTSIATDDRLAYAANLAYLRVVSLDDPAAPSEIARIENPTFARVATNGRIAITTHSYYGPREDMVSVLDVGRRDPSDIGTWQAIWGPVDVAVEGSKAFVTADGGLSALDLDDPANPVELSFLDLIESEHVAVDTGRAYVATMGAGGVPSFQVIDVADPSNMIDRGWYSWERGGPNPTAVDAAGDIAVIADLGGLRVMDVSDPSRVRQIGRLEKHGSTAVALVSHHAVLGYSSSADPDERGIVVVKLTAGEDPTQVGAWSSPSAVTAVVEFGGAVLVGTGADGVFMIALNDPSRPIEVDHWHLPGRAAVTDLAAAWPKVVVTHGSLGFTVLAFEVSCGLPRRPSGRISPSNVNTRYESLASDPPGSAVPPS